MKDIKLNIDVKYHYSKIKTIKIHFYISFILFFILFLRLNRIYIYTDKITFLYYITSLILIVSFMLVVSFLYYRFLQKIDNDKVVWLVEKYGKKLNRNITNILINDLTQFAEIYHSEYKTMTDEDKKCFISYFERNVKNQIISFLKKKRGNYEDN